MSERDKHPPERFGVTVRRLRLERGLSLERAGYATVDVDPERKGITFSTWGHIERGLHMPRPRTVELVAAALGIEPETFIDYRLEQARRLFDPRPTDNGGVGFDQAAANLAALEEIIGVVSAEMEALPGADAALEAEEEAARQAVDQQRPKARRVPGPQGNGQAAG